MPDAVPINKKAKIEDWGITSAPKKILARSLGPHVIGIVPPMADALDQTTLLEGAKYRFARAHPAPRSELVKELTSFVRTFIHSNLKPLPAGSVSTKAYVEQTHYTRSYKDHLLELNSRTVGQEPQIRAYKSFGKVERFKEGNKYKHLRCINPPPDLYKLYAAPYLHEVEKIVCKLRWFAKYVPVAHRARKITEMFAGMGGSIYCTDYTSFESSFSPEIIQATEGELYSYMLQEYPGRAEFINAWNSGRHNCRFKEFAITVPGVRMSGDPNTSLGNGFTNLMLTAFMCHRLGIQFEGMVEGDDGIFSFSDKPDFTEIAELGFQLKLEEHNSSYTTSFCGLMLSRSLAGFSDPRYNIAAFGWSHSQLRNGSFKVRMGLLRSKAISLLYCNPRCPMLTALAARYMHLTRGYQTITPRGYWENRMYEEALKLSDETDSQFKIGITEEDRLDFESIYHISPAAQKAVELYFSTAGLGPLDDPTLDSIYGDEYWVYRDYADRFTGTRAELDP